MTNEEQTAYVNGLVQQARLGFCPVCGNGPFRVLASHTSHAHELDRFALRDFLGLNFSESLCDDNWSIQRSQIARKHGNELRPTNRNNRRDFKKHLAHLKSIGFKPGHAFKRPRNIVHGTRTNYVYGCRCEQCKAAQKEYMRSYARAPKDLSSLKHGTLNAYNHRHCRCDLCRKAKADARASTAGKVLGVQDTNAAGSTRSGISQ